MDIAPSPSGLRIQDLGDRLVVQFRPKRSWGVLLFFAAWLAFWTFAGISAFAALLNAGWSEALFLLLWLCFWATFEVVMVVTIAWQLFGRELLLVTAEQLEVRKEIGRFARTKSYGVALVRDLKATRVPIAEEEQPRKDFCLEFTYHEKPVRIGEGMGEREAKHIAATVSARIHPRRTWWGEESPPEPDESPPEAAAPAAPRPRRRLRILAQIVFALLVLAAIASLLVVGRRDSDQGSTPQPPVDTSPRGLWGPPRPIRDEACPRLGTNVLCADIRQDHGLDAAGLHAAPDLVAVDLHRYRSLPAAALCRAHAPLPLLRSLHRRRPLRARPASVARRLISGASRDRTGDLCHAMAALSQLSYGPARAKCSGEFEVFRPVHACSLIVLGWCQPELNGAAVDEGLERKEVAAIHVRAVSREGIDFLWRVESSEQSIAIPTIRVARNGDDVAASRRPLALHANESWPQVEDQVVAFDGV